MRIVVAPDAFKGTVPARQAARSLGDGWLDVRPDDEVIVRPMADGGEGTLEAVESALPGGQRIPVEVTGPAGSLVAADWLLLPGGTGVVELASTSGIELLGGRLRPLDASTLGFGQAIAAALDHGVARLVLAIGSSASTDGGSGALAALGLRLTDAAGRPLGPGARGLADLVAVDDRDLRPPPPEGAVVLSDVTSPLLGPEGAAAVFGPQKGLDAVGVAIAEAGLARWVAAVRGAPSLAADPWEPGAGAAGGTGYALRAWGASIASGAAEVARIIRLAEAVADADLVITGEGSFDAPSARGKVPAHVAALAAAAGVPAALVAGRIAADVDTTAFARTIALVDLAGSTTASMGAPARWLRAAAGALALTFAG